MEAFANAGLSKTAKKKRAKRKGPLPKEEKSESNLNLDCSDEFSWEDVANRIKEARKKTILKLAKDHVELKSQQQIDTELGIEIGGRKFDDGVLVYTEEELGLHKRTGGGTKDCPFDCDCCY